MFFFHKNIALLKWRKKNLFCRPRRQLVRANAWGWRHPEHLSSAILTIDVSPIMSIFFYICLFLVSLVAKFRLSASYAHTHTRVFVHTITFVDIYVHIKILYYFFSSNVKRRFAWLIIYSICSVWSVFFNTHIYWLFVGRWFNSNIAPSHRLI